jgi:class 3 adenylate cyclase/tetratricopeptide (TPR) repeat protein
MLTLTLSLSPDDVLQQVLSNAAGDMTVGEFPGFSIWLEGKLSAPSSQMGISKTCFASRIHKALSQHDGSPLTVVYQSRLQTIAWEHLIKETFSSCPIVQVESIEPPANVSSSRSIKSAQSGKVSNSSVAAGHAPERMHRLVSTVSYDLIKSTQLIDSIGLEKYSFLVDEIHAQFAQIVQSWQGVAKLPQGDDGCMCYFGLDGAEGKTQYAALNAVLAMRKLAVSNDWAVRFGVASDMAAVSRRQPWGKSLHLADRLQKQAQMHQILVSSELALVTQDAFFYEDEAKSLNLTGFSSAQLARVLIGAVHTSTQGLGLNDSQNTSKLFVGRQVELKTLASHWAKTDRLKGHAGSITGEPGIGKTALVKAFLKATSINKTHVFVLRCYPETQGMAFAPLLALLRHWLEIASDASPDVYKTKIKELSLRKKFTFNTAEYETLSYLLSLHSPEASPFEPLEPQAQHSLFISRIVNWLALYSRQSKSLIVVEDYQWIDSSTGSLITALKNQIQNYAVMLLVTQRSQQFDCPVFSGGHFAIELARLPTTDSKLLIEKLTQNSVYQKELLQLIDERSNGVPFFIEESLKLAQQKNNELPTYTTVDTQTFKVADSIKELVIQRLDALGSHRFLVHLCSAIASEFSQDLIEKLVSCFETQSTSTDNLQSSLLLLVERGIFDIHAPSSDQKLYRFHHALIQDVAYESLWDLDRKHLHQQLCRVLKVHFPALIDSQPDLLARHLAASGQVLEGIEHLNRLGKQNRRKGAHGVAIHCFEAALQLAETIYLDSALQKICAELYLQLAGQVLITQGYGSTRTGMYYDKALNLSVQLNEPSLRLRALLGLESFHFMQGHFSSAKTHLDSADQVARGLGQPLVNLQCLWARANLMFHEGEVHEAAKLMAECDFMCEQHQLGSNLGQNPQIMAKMYRAYCLWSLGLTQQSLQLANEGCALSEQLPFKLSKLQAYGFLAMIHYCRGDWQAALLASETGLQACRQGEYEIWLSHAQFIKAAAQSRLGQSTLGLDQMAAADAAWAANGSVLTRTFYLCTRAEVHLELGHLVEAKNLLDEALNLVEAVGERYYATEVLRLRACWHMSAREDSTWHEQAQALIQRAQQDSSARGLHSLALRVALTAHDFQKIRPDIAKQGHGNFDHPASPDHIRQCLDALERGASGCDVEHANNIILAAEQSSSKLVFLSSYRRA